MTRTELVKRTGVATFALVVPPFVATRGVPSALAAITDLDTLTWGLATNVRSLDVAKSYDQASLTAMMPAVEPLVTYTNDLKLVGVLARSWSQPNPRTFRYKIRRGVKFWDGTPLTVDDVVFSLSRHLKPTSELSSLFASVKSVNADGPSDVVVHLKTPNVLFQYVLTAVPIYSKAFAQQAGANFGNPSASASILGTGAYEVTSFRSDEGISFTRNANYWGRKAISEKLELKLIEDPQTRQLALFSGQIDGAFNVPLKVADSWTRRRGVKVHFAPPLTPIFLTFDVTQAPWNDIHVRRAFAHAIDKKGLVNAAIRGHGLPANSVVPPAQWSTLLSKKEIAALYAGLPTYKFDLAKAKSEMAKSKTPDGFEVTVPFPTPFPEIGLSLQAIAENVKRLGIELKVVEQTQNKWLSDILAHKNLALHGMGLGPDVPDPANYLNYLLPSDAATVNGLNMANYRNPKVDALLDKQNAAISRKKRAAYLRQILHIIGRDLPYLPLFWESNAMAVREAFDYRGFTGFWTSQQWYKNVVER